MESLAATINSPGRSNTNSSDSSAADRLPSLTDGGGSLQRVLTPLLLLLSTEISEYEEGRRRSLSVQEGSTVLIECPLPHSVPPARPRLKVRGERIEVSTGVFARHREQCFFLLYFECMLPYKALFDEMI